MTGARGGQFDGVVAVVTGAAGGIGRACAALLAERGAHVVGVDCDERVGDPLATPDARWHGVVGDLVEVDTIERVWQVVEQTPGRCAVLVNCVFAEERAPLSSGTEAGWLHTYQVSTLTALRMSQRFVDRADEEPAAIVNVASVHAFGARAGFGAYAAAKAALLSFTRTAALEWGPRQVRVNAVAPGFVAVERNSHLWQDAATRDAIARANPLARIGHPDDVAAAVAFLASADASFITGTVLPVDGGLLAKLPEETTP
jgi:NAD(P)-dependent dehydrogenase (short-subunit alcohol dehydrogenase family)